MANTEPGSGQLPRSSKRRGPLRSGPGGARTHDSRIKSPLLCQLSYRPPRVNGSAATRQHRRLEIYFPAKQALISATAAVVKRAG